MKTITQPLSRAHKFFAFWIFSLLIVFSVGVIAQPPSATITQGRNGTPSNPVSPVNWTGGNVGNQQGHYVECWSVPYRCVMPNMPAGTDVVITFEFDATHSSKQAIDFITTYDNMNDNAVSAPHSIFGHSPELIQPWDGTSILDGSSEVFAPIPEPPYTGFEMSGQPIPIVPEPVTTFNSFDSDKRRISIFSGDGTATFNYFGTGTFDDDPTPVATAFEYLTPADLTLAQASQQFRVYFNTGNGGTIILAWGGHIASTATWGYDPVTLEPNSAVAINGSPYHMRLIDWNLGNLGHQDLSLNADAVYSAPPCDYTIISNPFCVGEGNSATLDQTDPAWTYSWEIVDDPVNPTGALFDNGLTTTSGSPTVYFNATSPGQFTLYSQVTVLYNGEILTSTCGAETTVVVN
ncbi:MAG: hypothetical protein RQ761_05285, partial [Bacteroidales bacterium]|nr:hypothetical protein [Bacteroidales bacterium]